MRLIVLAFAAVATLSAVLKSRTSSVEPAPAAFPVENPGGLTVAMRGDVVHPGIYRLPVNSVTDTVIQMAVPARPLIGLVPDRIGGRRLDDAVALELSIDRNGQGRLKFASLTTRERLVLGIPLDLNRMESADFDLLPGVGPALAERIVTYRQSVGGAMRVEELRQVEGIGEKRYQALKKLF